MNLRDAWKKRKGERSLDEEVLHEHLLDLICACSLHTAMRPRRFPRPSPPTERACARPACAHPDEADGDAAREAVLALLPRRHAQLAVREEPVEADDDVRRRELEARGRRAQVLRHGLVAAVRCVWRKAPWHDRLLRRGRHFLERRRWWRRGEEATRRARDGQGRRYIQP